ncbi:MAG: hypothetical protein JWP04_631, partial [Belnapia sp.]|nr:hypothetical protein [Belnapia sp.]
QVGGAIAGATHEAAAAAEVAAPGLGLLALQERGSDAERDGAARRRAEAILEELDGLLADMLAGSAGGDPERLRRLAGLEQGEEGADPGLRDAVRGVVLRARVELARRGRGEAATVA